MQLRYLKAILPPCEGISKVTALVWSPNSRRLAAVTTDRVVHLFDENGDRKDKFATKPAEPKGPKRYLVTGMAFSPDSTKLAVAQSDNIVFVYKLGTEWGDKKSICNKFHQSSLITCITWPALHPQEVMFGLADGKVKVGQLKSNKAATLYAHPDNSPVVNICASPDGVGLLSAHLDGSIFRFLFDDGATAVKLVHHVCVPSALAWGESIVAAGSDCKVAFYDRDGSLAQQFDYSSDETAREFTVACFNPSGETAVVGSFNCFHIFSYNMRVGKWEEVGVKHVENLYTVTSFAWKPDGSRLTVGGLCGNVDIFDACIRRNRYKGKFEFTYVSKSQVIVKRLASGTRIVLKSHFGLEVMKINIYHDQYLIAHTPETLLLGDLESCQLSEVPWSGSGNERFILDNPAVCMIYNAGELSLVEYGMNEILGSCRTEHLSPFLISVRLNEGRHNKAAGHPHSEENKKMAYLIDLQTIRVLDLCSGVTLATVSHDSKIDWLELNPRVSHLLFRDKKRQLHLYDLKAQERTTLLNYCSYVQWAPNTDVVVGQNRNNLCVWYSIHNPERVTVFPVKGEVEDIERSKGRTEVIVDEGLNTVSYALDESLIEFGAAVEDRDYERAVAILEPLDLTPESEAMWEQLSSMALEDEKLQIAERCYAALGHVAKARYLHKVNKQRDVAIKEAQDTSADGMDHFMVRAQLAMLQRHWKKAELLLLEQGRVEDAIKMYTECHRWKDAIAVAEGKSHPSTEALRRDHYQWLLQTGQEGEAGSVKEAEGDYMGAIALYLKGGLPGRAALCVNSNASFPFQNDLLESIASALSKANMHEKAGDFFERLGMNERAKDAYRRGHAYRRAVDLARRVFPSDVVTLEEEWGDWLVSQKQVDAAINHFIEAGNSSKAIEAAMSSRQWAKAVQIVEALDAKTAAPFYKRIARHYEAAKNYEEAEKFFVRAKLPGEAVDMYTRSNKWEAAHKVAARYMSEAEAAVLYTRRARELEGMGRYREAEKMYLEVKEYDMAINMYKKAPSFENMIRLVSKYRKDLVVETHLHLAQQLEGDGNFREAEQHYIEIKDWKSVVQMYRANDMWDEAIRVAKLYGGVAASKQVAYAWAVSLGGEAGAQLLTKFGLVEQAIDYALESSAFAHAFELCRASLKQKLPEVHLKYAMFLEDGGHFLEAEEEFIKADKPREAIDMYIHQQDWPSAMRVADAFDPASTADIQVAQARLLVERKEYPKAEVLFLKAKHPELAIRMYKDLHQWDDAVRLAEDYLPSKVADIHAEMAASMRTENEGAETGESILQRARALEKSRNYGAAIDAYLMLTSEMTADMDHLEQVWETAVKLAMSHVHDRISEIVGVVAKRLVEIGRYEQAAELHVGIDGHKDAADAYMRGNLWEKARSLASNAGPKIHQYVEAQYKQYLMQNEEADQLVESGNVAEAIELYARQQEWPRVHELAARQGADVAARYAARHAKQCAQSGHSAEAASVLARHGLVMTAALWDLYKVIARDILAALDDSPTLNQALQDLRAILFKLVSTLRTTKDTTAAPHLAEFERLLSIVHLSTLRSVCQQEGLQEIAAKISIALLRYIGDIPADRAFFEAGIAARAQGWQNMAFVLLNRYLDLAEAMDDVDGNTVIENEDFADTDIPHDFTMPERHFLDEERRESVRDWVLELSMDQQVEQSLSVVSCEHCSEPRYIAALSCANSSCKAKSQLCCVTGYPVLQRTRVSCKSCNMPANREDWNQFVLKCEECPWCSFPQHPIY